MPTKHELERFLADRGLPAALTIPGDPAHGDLTTALALASAPAGQNPRQFAESLAHEFRSHFPDLNVAVVGPGFLNIRLTDAALINQLPLLAASELSHALAGQTILVEYSQPNIAKPMHFGHLRTTVLGESIKRLSAAAGATAIGINHLGDWGSQFGKLLAAYKRWGNRAQLEAGGIHEMLRLYVQFHEEAEHDPTLLAVGAQEFAKLEKGDKENTDLWQLMRAVSLVEFRRFYRRLGIAMDEPEIGESDYRRDLDALIDRAIATGQAQESEGAIVINVGPDLPPCLIRKSDGATIYATRDLAAIEYRIKRWQPTKIVYVVAADQALHFQQVFRAATKLGLAEPSQLIHVPYGLVRLPEGKMSTRAGRVIFLDDVLDEAVERAGRLLADKSPDIPVPERAKIAEQIGVGAISYAVLNQNRNSPIVFAWEKIVSLQGNTGPYLQYTVARARSVVAKADSPAKALPADALLTDQERLLVRWLWQLPTVVEQAAREYAPNRLADWLYRLASEFNAWYERVPILQSAPDDRRRRVALTQLVASGLARGLDLLGIAVPNRL